MNEAYNMPLKDAYIVWNNKGGVGKTTLTFHLSTEYAHSHPNEDIVVLDMCPQANVSAALLSSVNELGVGQQGDEMVREIARYKVNCNDAEGSSYQNDQTVGGYLMAKIEKRGFKYEEFLVHPRTFNKYVPDNMRLLCGDSYLEVIAKRLEGERLLESSTKEGPWERVTKFMKAFVDGVVKSDHRRRKYTFFIDSSPSFAVYTELAVVAATRLIVPFNADDFSRTSVKSMLYLLYGIEIDNERQEKYSHLRQYEFWFRAKHENISLPKIYLLINNKITQYRKGVAKAFGAKEKEISDHIQTVMREEPSRFEDHPDFKIILELNDLHTIAVQCLHLGCPLRNLPTNVEMGDAIVRNASKNKEEYIEKLTRIVKLL